MLRLGDGSRGFKIHKPNGRYYDVFSIDLVQNLEYSQVERTGFLLSSIIESEVQPEYSVHWDEVEDFSEITPPRPVLRPCLEEWPEYENDPMLEFVLEKDRIKKWLREVADDPFWSDNQLHGNCKERREPRDKRKEKELQELKRLRANLNVHIEQLEGELTNVTGRKA